MRIASFNLQNMRLRGAHLDGARDGDTGEDADPALDHRDRALSAQVLRDTRADIVICQEVFDRATLDHFHDRFLVPSGAAPYPHRVCLPGNDGRGQDIAVLSRLPLDQVVSHADLRSRDLGLEVPDGINPDAPIFRRDCLMIDAGHLTLLACHFKAPHPDPRAAWPVRRLEAQAVRALIDRRYDDPAQALWLVIGDLNEPMRATDDPAIATLLPPFSENLMARLPQGARWSYYNAWDNAYGRPDKLLASPALARACPDAIPEILREGLPLAATRNTGAHLPDVGHHRPHASDHAAIVIDLTL